MEYIQSTKNRVTYHAMVQDIAVIYNGASETTLLHFNRGMSISSDILNRSPEPERVSPA